MKSAATPIPRSAEGAAREAPAVPAGRGSARAGGRVPAAAGVCVGAALILAWVLAYPHTPDLAGQVYRVGLFEHSGFIVWDEHWYAGHHIPAYSLLFPLLGSLLGIRLLGAAAVLASCFLFERLASPVYGQSARWGAAFFAVAAVGDVWAGRVAFALGVCVALAAALAFARGRTAIAVVLSVLCAASSPVAALSLGLAALALSVHRRSPRAVLALGLPAGLLVLALAALFPEGGYEPFPIRSFAATAVVVLLFLWALPPSARLLRTGGVIYLAACTACLLIHSPIGSNIERLGVLLAGPLLLCALASDRARSERGSRVGPVAALALCAAALWVLWGPVRETRAVAGSPATSAAYYTPLERFLAGVPGPVRVEVPLTRTHWEAALLAPAVSLARGWDKQLEERYDHVLISPSLTPASYRRWLADQAVAYVALPDVPLDGSSAQEGRLIRSGLAYLREVARSPHWRIFRVIGATPLAQGPGTLTGLGHDWLSLRADAAGSFLVRAHYTRYWTATSGAACISRAAGGWTRLTVPRPGPVTIAARFSLGRAFGQGGSCETRPGG